MFPLTVMRAQFDPWLSMVFYLVFFRKKIAMVSLKIRMRGHSFCRPLRCMRPQILISKLEQVL